jgi:hypothetical protein
MAQNTPTMEQIDRFKQHMGYDSSWDECSLDGCIVEGVGMRLQICYIRERYIHELSVQIAKGKKRGLQFLVEQLNLPDHATLSRRQLAEQISLRAMQDGIMVEADGLQAMSRGAMRSLALLFNVDVSDSPKKSNIARRIIIRTLGDEVVQRFFLDEWWTRYNAMGGDEPAPERSPEHLGQVGSGGKKGLKM